MLKTKQTYPNICFKVWGIYLKHKFQHRTVFKIQNGAQNGCHFYIYNKVEATSVEKEMLLRD